MKFTPRKFLNDSDLVLKFSLLTRDYCENNAKLQLIRMNYTPLGNKQLRVDKKSRHSVFGYNSINRQLFHLKLNCEVGAAKSRCHF